MKIVHIAPGERITKPGFYQMSAEQYFADPVEKPSFSQSIGKVLLDQSPLHAKYEHPRLRPATASDDGEKYEKNKAIGNAAHSLLIGRGKNIAIIKADSFKSKAAQEERDAAIAEHKEPVIEAHYELALQIVNAARAQLETCGWGDLFNDSGAGEVVLAWKEGEHWLRVMVDFLASLTLPVDLKTTGGSASPQNIPSKIYEDGWDIQTSMIERGLDALDPDSAGRREYRYVCIENYEPFALTPIVMPESILSIGRRRLTAAIQLWKRAVETGQWEGYPTQPMIGAFPDWGEGKWLKREIELFDAGLIDFGKDPVMGKPLPSRAPKVSTINAG